MYTKYCTETIKYFWEGESPFWKSSHIPEKPPSFSGPNFIGKFILLHQCSGFLQNKYSPTLILFGLWPSAFDKKDFHLSFGSSVNDHSDDESKSDPQMDLPILDLKSSETLIDHIYTMDFLTPDVQELGELEFSTFAAEFFNHDKSISEMFNFCPDSNHELIIGEDHVLSPGPKQMMQDFTKEIENTNISLTENTPVDLSSFLDIHNTSLEDSIWCASNLFQESSAHPDDFLYSSLDFEEKNVLELANISGTKYDSLGYENVDIIGCPSNSISSSFVHIDSSDKNTESNSITEIPTIDLEECVSIGDEEFADVSYIQNTSCKERRKKIILKDMSEAEKYRRIRKQNNTASRKCRVKRKAMLKEKSSEISELTKENNRLKKIYSSLKAERDELRKLFSNYMIKK